MAIEIGYWSDFKNEEERQKAFQEGPFVIVYAGGWRVEVDWEKVNHPILPDSSIYNLQQKWGYDQGKFPWSEKQKAVAFCDLLNKEVKNGSIVKTQNGIWKVK